MRKEILIEKIKNMTKEDFELLTSSEILSYERIFPDFSLNMKIRFGLLDKSNWLKDYSGGEQ
ncbi:MAG: hypothetical protein ACFFCZ_20300 [Promethearchaeota archaeon]